MATTGTGASCYIKRLIYQYPYKVSILLWTEHGHISGLVQERCNSIANTLELCLYSTNPLIRLSSLSIVHFPCTGKMPSLQWISNYPVLFLTHWGHTKWPPFSRRQFQMDFFNENVWISIKISLNFVPRVTINNIPSLVQIIALCLPGDKPLSEPMMVSLLT